MTTITMEEYEFMKEPKYRMYVAAVDKALKSFEYTSEWADLISALGKLNKVLLGYTKFPVIPRRIKISKRLAQCMHPALPSGVHLRALETYDIIFKSMGTNRLSNELFIYSAGLFPLLGHAAMNIRPALLLVYETHFVPLEARLRPALSGFLSGILPGLEIGSDHFDRTNVLLENVCKGVGPDWFYTCVWQCVRTNSPVRLPAISYILAHYSRKVSMEDQLYLMGNDIDVMVSGLCAAVQDSSVLVQRSALDLLLVCFPMQNTQLLYADMVRLVTSSLITILRRDMSLNRRLYSWLLSSDISSATNQSNDLSTPDILESASANAYSPFDTTGSPSIAFDLLTEAIRTTLKQCSAEATLDVKPYRLLTSLFEKPQIGPLILDVVLYDVFRALYHACLTQQRNRSANVARCVSFNGNLTSLKSSQLLTKEFVSRNCHELVKNANLLFNTLQSYYIWSYIAKLYEKSATDRHKRNSISCGEDLNINEIGSGAPDMLEICLLADFLLDIIPLETFVENTSEILPSLFMRIIVVLKNNISSLNRYEITHSLTLCMKIVTKIQPGIIKVQSQIDPNTSAEDCVLNISGQELEKIELKSGLEKSKSDSKLNDKLNKNELTITTSARERSNSNQMLKKKEQKSPKIDKRTKNKKSKSSSKLDDLRKDNINLENESEEVKIEVEKTANDLTINHSNNNNINKVDSNNNKYIKRCLELYEQFFVVFIENKIMPDVRVDNVFKTFIRDQEVLRKELEILLEKCLESNTDKVELNSLIHETRSFKASMFDVAISDYDIAMKIASNLLIEFATFPSLLDNNSSDNSLPYWLQVLIVCACSAQSGHEIQIIAMSTLMEIFSLAKSQIHQRKTLESGNNKIVVMGILEHKHIVYIECSTIVLEVMSRYLWELLGALSNQSDIMLCVSLLYSLHNTFDTNPIVEQVIGQYLVNENLTTEHIKRFYMLWHLGRDLNIRLSNNAHIKNFDRSLLKIFDNLQHAEKSNTRLLSETFLTHSLLRNDIARIINPIMQKLLAPSTARISIRHVHIQDTDSTTEITSQDQQAIDDAKAKQIYAISSENGNVRYHVTSKTGQSPKPKKRWYLLSKVGRKYAQVINMTTSLTENLNIVTKQNKDFNVDLTSNLDQRTSSKSTVKLFINPLSSKEIYPDGIDGSYTKIDPHRLITSTESISSNEDSSELENQSTDNKLLLSPNGTRLQFLERIEPITNGIKDRPAVLLKSQSFDEKRAKADLESSLYHSWSYSISESDNVNNENNELEFSTSAEEFFENSENVVSEILNEILYKVCATAETDLDAYLSDGVPRDVETNIPKLNDTHVKNFTLFPMHCHLCLYYEVFDSYQILYSLKTLKSCLVSNPHLFIRCLATTGLTDMKSNEILNLLARHRKSLLGNGFSGEINQDYHNFYRGYMFLDIILLVCLNYARSFYPMIFDLKLTKEEINNNQQIQLDSLEILDIIIKYLIGIVNDNAKGFGKYIADMLVKCKLQKVLLHCLLTSVRKIEDEVTFAEEVLLFNGFRLYDQHKRVSEYVEAYQIQLLRLIHSVVILEYHVFPASEPEELLTEHLYTPTIPIPKQEMFLSAVVSALRHQNMKHLHQNWCNMVTSCLPYFQDNLKHICLRVIFHICNNVERIAETYKHEEISGELCPDYATTQLESLSVLVHYCLLDASQTANHNLPLVGGGVSSLTSLTNNGEIFSNLVNAFFSPIGGEINLSSKQNTENYQLARKMVLSHMPRIISSVAKLWQTIVGIDCEFHSIFGNCKMVKQQLLEFLSPIAVHHSSSFLAAVSVAWNDRRNPFSTFKTILPEPNESQNNMVYLISAIRVIPLDNLVQTVIAVIKNPPPTEGLSADVCLDVSVLELFYCYMRNASETQLCEAWSSLMALMREGCSLAPAAQFLLVALLHELMIKCCPMEERKDQKDLQDVTAKLIESVSQVCGSCLEQTTWLRRNLAVKEQDYDSLSRFSSISATNSETLSSVNSVQAQLVLSEILAQILDICFGSSEKDKVNTILTSLMYNIVPYLKTHTNKNMPSFGACSKLLSSLSSFQYTRKAWRKDVFDLLLDNSLFQMDHSCLKYWKIIIDNLMTHDNTTFKDLMARVSMTQSGGLSIFSSREQEYEQRAQLLKRLAFVIFCSEVDQYAKYMPEIQEQLTTSLRISVPGIQAQVFLCFRVLLLRMSQIQMTSLWPIIISEMLQVFIQIEQELTTDSEEFSAHIKLLSGLDASWATNSNNGLHALGHPHWLRLQLAACKLLDLALLLPATSLPQFQMYRWAFVGDDLAYNNQHRKRPPNTSKTTSFLPHVTRIANLMDQKYVDSEIEIMSIRHNELLLTMNSIAQLKELCGFFKTLSLCSNRHRTECNGSVNNDYVILDRYVTDKKVATVLDKLDRVMEMDFLDKIPR